MTDRTLLDKLEPIDPTTQVDRIPGIDAVCEAGKGERECRWPFCVCFHPGPLPEGGIVSITPTTSAAETHTLAFDEGAAVEVSIADSGEVSVLVFGTSPVDFSIDVWRDIVKCVEKALEVTAE